MNDQPELLADEERECLEAAAELEATIQRIIQDVRPAFQALAAQFADLATAMRNVRAGRQGDFALCPAPDIAETTAEYERLTGHAATCTAGFTDACDCPPATTQPENTGDGHA